MAAGLRLVTERTGGGAGQPVFDGDNGEELMHVQPGVSIVLGNCPPDSESSGTLYISNKQVVWLSGPDRAKGYAVDFVSVSLHAVSRHPEAYSSPCIYAQIETGYGNDGSEDADSGTSDTVNLSKITEIRLVPSDPNQLNTLFAIFCQCAELNPDPAKEEEEEEEEEVEHNWIFSADQLEHEFAEDDDPEWGFPLNVPHPIGANGNHDLAHSVFQLQINDQRFEDADEMEHSSTNGSH